MSVFARLKAFDFYRKLPSDLAEPTVSGAIVSLTSTLIILILFLTEFFAFLNTHAVSEMFIDTNRGGDKLTVNLDLELPKLPCDLVSLDSQDVMGSHHVNVGGNLYKRRITKEGKVIEEIKFEDGDTSFNRERAKQAFTDQEGCQLVGNFEVYKVPGNFHISSHAYGDHIYPVFLENYMSTIDLSHKINHISFGDDNDLKEIKRKFDKGVLNPLDNIQKVKPDALKNIGVMYQYYISVVPTTYQDLNGKRLFVHQFTVHSNEIQTQMLPALYFRYDLSPVTVKYTLTKATFFRFLVQVCGIVGGVFTIAGIIDAFVHKSVVKIMKKAQINKLG